jgi:hypothetical protein
MLTNVVGNALGHSLGSFGTEMMRAGAHGLVGGAMSYLDGNGNSFFQGFAVSSVASLAGSGLQAAGMGSVATMSGFAGMGAAFAVGANPMSGFFQGYGVGLYNHEDLNWIHAHQDGDENNPNSAWNYAPAPIVIGLRPTSNNGAGTYFSNMSNLSNIIGAYSTVRGTWMWNPNGNGGWTGRNGQYYRFSQNPMNNITFRNSANIAKNVSQGLRSYGTGMGVFGMATSVISSGLDLVTDSHNTSTWVNLGLALGGGTLAIVGSPMIVTGAVIGGTAWGVAQIVAGDRINGWIDNNFGYR